MPDAFDFKKRLGAGYFGEVWQVVDTGLSFIVALKCIPKSKIVNQSNFFQEAQTLKASEHPNIVKVNDTGTLSDGRIYVSMEYLPTGSLEDVSKGAPIPLSQAKNLMTDVLRGLGHAHSKDIVHRDIKPANILIGNTGEAKLSDFGLALPDFSGLDISQLKQYQYTLHLAPEVKQLKDYTKLSDIYAAGVTLYRLVNGDSRLPQIEPSQAQILARKGLFPPRDGYRDYVPLGLMRVINRAIEADPAKRFQTADEMRHALEGQNPQIDWSESVITNATIWLGSNRDGRQFQVSKQERADGHWRIETKIGKSVSSLRRISAYCHSKLSRAKADTKARNILRTLGRPKK